MSDLFVELQKWYASQCDGVWEHSYGIEIVNIDNPGWRITITGASERDVVEEKIDRSDDNWVRINAESTKFIGYGGPENLEELIRRAANWLRK
ncbi:TPA: immunity 53 family protein [Stenotrophomonas maltophilia]|nr:immunity 53 family protein [Stenotrophomonas maltophilia]